ncbi:LysM peptidoglycan-binding domain-containing protein [Paraglaciecola aestuariivivens]
MKRLILVISLFILVGCSGRSANQAPLSQAEKNLSATDTTLSHIQAYLLIGNTTKAEQLLNQLDSTQLPPKAKVLLAELHAAKGNSVEAQQSFLSAIADMQANQAWANTQVPVNLLDYFCDEKKWPALEGYAKTIVADISNASDSLNENQPIKQKVLTQIGLCFFSQQKWQQTSTWLNQLELSSEVDPLVYLALARASIEQQDLVKAQQLISHYQQYKKKVDAPSLWAAIEVHLALGQQEQAKALGETLRSLFHYNEYSRQYILLTKRGMLDRPTSNSSQTLPPEAQQEPSATDAVSASTPALPFNTVHTIQKGETLYRLSKLYGLTTAELQAWNPELDVNDIPIGTQIRVVPNR